MADPEPANPSKTPSEETSVPSDPPIDDIKAQKMARIQANIDALNAEIKATSEKLDGVRAGLRSPLSAAQTVKTHIKLLHQYNEMRDVGQGLLGLVAEKRGCRVADLYCDEDGDGSVAEGGEGGGGRGGGGVGEFGVGVHD